MLNPLEHNALRAILLFQSIMVYLENDDVMSLINKDELESFNELIVECFKVAKEYDGENEDIKDGCRKILSTKDDVSKFCPKVNAI